MKPSLKIYWNTTASWYNKQLLASNNIIKRSKIASQSLLKRNSYHFLDFPPFLLLLFLFVSIWSVFSGGRPSLGVGSLGVWWLVGSKDAGNSSLSSLHLQLGCPLAGECHRIPQQSACPGQPGPYQLLQCSWLPGAPCQLWVL